MHNLALSQLLKKHHLDRDYFNQVSFDLALAVLQKYTKLNCIVPGMSYNPVIIQPVRNRRFRQSIDRADFKKNSMFISIIAHC